MNTRSLRFRLIVGYACLLTLVVLCFAALTHKSLAYFMEQVLNDTLTHRAKQIAQTLLADAKTTGEEYVRDEIEARYAPQLNDRYIRITSNDGMLFYRSESPIDQLFNADEVPDYQLDGS